MYFYLWLNALITKLISGWLVYKKWNIKWRKSQSYKIWYFFINWYLKICINVFLFTHKKLGAFKSSIVCTESDRKLSYYIFNFYYLSIFLMDHFSDHKREKYVAPPEEFFGMHASEDVTEWDSFGAQLEWEQRGVSKGTPFFPVRNQKYPAKWAH